MPIFVAGVIRIRLAAVFAFTAIVALAVLGAVREYRASHVRRLLADLNSTQPATGYAIEAQKVSTASDDWKAYCYRERESLIEEARAASQ